MEKVRVGDTIKIIKMEGEPQYTGREGVVTHIDDAGQIHGTWGGCAVLKRIFTEPHQAEGYLYNSFDGLARYGILRRICRFLCHDF